MSNDKYKWMLGLAAAFSQANRGIDSDDDDQPSLSLSAVVGRAGFFKGRLPAAVNDQKFAAFLALVFLWFLACAKYRANSLAICGGRRKLTPAEIFSPIRPIPLSHALSVSFGLSHLVCQINHLSTW